MRITISATVPDFLKIKHVKNKLTLLSVLVFISVGSEPILAQWSATNLSGNINTVFSNGTILLAGTNGGTGVLGTSDDGSSWGAANVGMDQYPDVRAFAANSTYIYAGTTGGVYRCIADGMYNWTKVLNNVSCFSLLINSSGIYAGTMGGGVYFSSDNGTTWTQVNNSISMLYVYALAYNGTYLFAGTYHNGSTPGAGVFRSNDNGQTWTQVNNGMTNTNIMSFAVKGTMLFAGTDGGGIFRTTDNGNNWVNVAGGVVHTLKVVCGTDLYAGFLSGGGISRSTDNGNTWAAYSTGLPNTGGYTVMSIDASSTKLFAGTLGGGVAKADKNCTTQSAACISWNLTSSQAVTSTSGNISGQSEIISTGSSAPLMQVYGYNNGQELWVGNTGWVPFPTNTPAEDPLRYLQFNTSPTAGNSFTVNSVSFNYGDTPLGTDFNILSFLAYYSTDGWSTRTLLNSSALNYKNTAMNTFTLSGLGVAVANGQTFSLRIYPYPILHGIAMTPTFAIHNNVSICGTTEAVKTGSICGQKFNDLNGNGVQDSGEPGLANWVINLRYQNASGLVTIKDTTDINGNFCFNNLNAGAYNLWETNQTGWSETYPMQGGIYSINLLAGQTANGYIFGNHQLGSPACLTWNLLSSQSVTNTTGNVSGQSEIISTGSSAPLMQVYGYNNGQELWVGNTGWVPFPTNTPAEDPLRYLQFNTSPTAGNSFTVNSVSFNYGDTPLSTDFNILSFLAYYSTDGWSTRTLLNSSALIYKNTTMNTFTVSGLSVAVANGQTFSLRIYPYPILHGIAMTPTFAIHNNVSICGTTKPAKTGSICGQKFNDLNGNGVKDSGELGLANWVISIKIQNAAGWVILKDTTDVNGNYCFNNLPAGTYTVSEINQSGWLQTFPDYPGTHNVIFTEGQNITGIDFGNKQSSCIKSWTPLTTGTNGEVWALAVIGTDLYVGGNFTTAGGNTANHIAKWNGSAWSPLVSANTAVNGINGMVSALTVIGTDLYAGGWFTNAGGVPALNVAKWDGSNWTALGSGISAAGAINALVAMGNNIFATSYILDPTLGGQGHIIAKWDGSNWSQFTSMDDYVSTFLVDGTNLYAGGQFTLIGTVPANHIAKWDGTNWTALGVGTDFFIGGAGLEMMSGKLYVGGRFLNAGGSTANFIAGWDGSAWSSFGSGSNIGMNNEVECVKAMGGELYASGSFSTAQGISANSIAKWDGTLWSPLGTGMNDGVWRLAVVGSDLYAGGIFTTAGSNSANYIAKYSCTGPTAINEPQQNQQNDLIQNQPNPFSSNTLIKYFVPETGLVHLSVYDIYGKEMNVLVNEIKQSGYYERTFDAKNLTSGIYFYSFSTNGLTQSRKMILIK